MRKNNGFGDTKAKRHEIEDIDIYEVLETELDILEKNSVSDLCLEFGIATTSVFFSFLCALLVFDFDKQSLKVYNFFLFTCIISFLASLILLSIWGTTHKNKKEIINKVKARKVTS